MTSVSPCENMWSIEGWIHHKCMNNFFSKYSIKCSPLNSILDELSLISLNWLPTWLSCLFWLCLRVVLISEGIFFSPPFFSTKKWTPPETDVRCQTSALPHLTTWRRLQFTPPSSTITTVLRSVGPGHDPESCLGVHGGRSRPLKPYFPPHNTPPSTPPDGTQHLHLPLLRVPYRFCPVSTHWIWLSPPPISKSHIISVI